MGTVKVHGRIQNLLVGSAADTVSVTVETSKGVTSKTARVSDGEFSVEIQFGTQSAPYSPLLGHRCNSVPNTVNVEALVGNRIVGRARLSFKDDFELEGSSVYRLKHELTLRAASEEK
jgi:hypothetical protein